MNKLQIEIKDGSGNPLPLSALSVETFKAMQEQEKPDKKEPEPLRHGDYGDYGERGRDRWIKIWDKVWWLSGQRYPSTHPDTFFSQSKKGNISDVFDDLALLGEDLEEFEMKSVCNSHLGIAKDDDKHIALELLKGCGDRVLSLDQAEQFSQKLRQVIATLRRKK